MTKNRTIHEIDAKGKILGRLASEIALLLRGKHKPTFSYHLDEGDSVLVFNVDKIKLSGNKMNQKVYRHHSGYPGGLKTENIGDLMKRNPSEVLRRAVYNMLPKNKLRDRIIKRLNFKIDG